MEQELKEENLTELGFKAKEVRLKVATRQARFYQSLEASLNSNWAHINHPLIKKIGLSDYLLNFKLECKRHRDEITNEITGLLIVLGLSGDDDDD